jgi:4,5-DOPA dioxygenase extradiol
MQLMPIIFCAHGSPMNAIADNDFTRKLKTLKDSYKTPTAILVISAHWQTSGTFVTAMDKPKTIHDFHGFPKELYNINYPAPGNPKLAQTIIDHISEPKIKKDLSEWGLDHGTWSVLVHLYPNAEIPVLQLSIDMSVDPLFHFELGKKLHFLRSQGVLILASGNIVHNLSKISWDDNATPVNWSLEFDQWVDKKISEKDYHALIHDFRKSTNGQLAQPYPDHYIPLLYILGAIDERDQVRCFFEGIQNGSISMRSYIWE